MLWSNLPTFDHNAKNLNLLEYVKIQKTRYIYSNPLGMEHLISEWPFRRAYQTALFLKLKHFWHECKSYWRKSDFRPNLEKITHHRSWASLNFSFLSGSLRVAIWKWKNNSAHQLFVQRCTWNFSSTRHITTFKPLTFPEKNLKRV